MELTRYFLSPASNTILISSADIPRLSMSCFSAIIALVLWTLYQQIPMMGASRQIATMLSVAIGIKTSGCDSTSGMVAPLCQAGNSLWAIR